MQVDLSAKIILDATAGKRMMWTNKTNPYTLFVDCREEVNPDIVADHSELKFLESGKFKLIVFDPPHMKRPAGNNATGNLTRDYGALKSDSWESDLQRAFKELWRLLEPYGVLLFKWNDHDVKVEKLLRLFPAEPLISQTSKGNANCPYGQTCKAKVKSRFRTSKTYWFTFMKFPENPHLLACSQRSET